MSERPQKIRHKWRPSLALVVAGTVSVVAGLPVVGALVVGDALGRNPYAMMASLTSEVGMWTSGLVLLVTASIGFVLWRLILGPVQDLSVAAQAVAEGRSDGMPVLHRYGTREIVGLGRALVEMGAALENKATGVRDYSDHVTHELKSPLTTLTGALELLQDDTLTPDQRAKLLGSMGGAAQRMSDLLGAMQHLARAREPFGTARLAWVSEGLPAVEGLEIDLTEDTELPMSPEALAAVLQHLCQNAKSHGATWVTIAPQDGGFDLFDNGPGVSEGNRTRVFDPFFTTRRDAGGTGLGLSIALSFVETARGTLTLAPSAKGEGARFEVRF